MKQEKKGQAYTAESLQDPQAVAEMKRAVGESDELPTENFQESELVLSEEARKASKEAAVARLVRFNELAAEVARTYRQEAVLEVIYESRSEPKNYKGIAEAIAWREQTLGSMDEKSRKKVLFDSRQEAISMLKKLATISVDEALSGKTGKFCLFNSAEEYEKNGENGEKRWHGSTHLLLECYEHTVEKSGGTNTYIRIRPVWFVGGLKWLADGLRKNERYITLREFQASIHNGRVSPASSSVPDNNHLYTMMRAMVRAVFEAREDKAKRAEKATTKAATAKTGKAAKDAPKAAKKSVRKKKGAVATSKRSVRTTSTRE